MNRKKPLALRVVLTKGRIKRSPREEVENTNECKIWDSDCKAFLKKIHLEAETTFINIQKVTRTALMKTTMNNFDCLFAQLHKTDVQ